MAHKRVLSIGQCGFDDSRLSRVIASAGGRLERAASADEAIEKIGAGDYRLVLVNRVFDSGGESGVDFIATLAKCTASTPLMLVSDYADAQAAAIANGAQPGFGKSQLGDEALLETLRQTLARKDD